MPARVKLLLYSNEDITLEPGILITTRFFLSKNNCRHCDKRKSSQFFSQKNYQKGVKQNVFSRSFRAAVA